MYATPAARRMTRSPRGVTARQQTHTLTVATTSDHLQTGTGYQFVVEGTASIAETPSFGDFATQIGPLTVVSGWVRGQSDQWNIDGRILNFRIQASTSDAYQVTLDGQAVGASEVVPLTGGDQATVDEVLSAHYGSTNGGNGGSNGGTNGGNGGSNGGTNGGNGGGNGGVQPPSGISGRAIIAIILAVVASFVA